MLFLPLNKHEMTSHGRHWPLASVTSPGLLPRRRGGYNNQQCEIKSFIRRRLSGLGDGCFPEPQGFNDHNIELKLLIRKAPEGSQ